MHYIVTGAAGFIGSNLCKRLLSEGYRVLGVDNLSSASPMHEELLYSQRYKFINLDISAYDLNDQLPVRFAKSTAAIIHLASPASPVDYWQNQIATLRAGARGTETALELARRLKCRMIITSTSEVYGNPSVHPQTEDYWGNVNPIGPRSMYDESKRYAEALCLAYHREHDVDVGILRLFNTYGPGMRVDDGRLVPTAITQALRGQPVTVHGSGEQTRSLCYIDDTVDAMISFAKLPRVTGPINVGNPDERSVASICNLIAELCGSTAGLRYLRRPGDDPDRRQPDVTLAYQYMRWRPKTSLAEGLKTTIRYISELA